MKQSQSSTNPTTPFSAAVMNSFDSVSNRDSAARFFANRAAPSCESILRVIDSALEVLELSDDMMFDASASSGFSYADESSSSSDDGDQPGQ